MIKRIEYNYKDFLKNYLKSTPIEVGNLEAFEKESYEDFKEIETYFTDEFVNNFYDWVKEKYSDVEINDLKPRCFEIEGVGPFLIGQRFKSGDINMPFILLTIGFDEDKLFSVIEDIKKIARDEFKKINPIGLTVITRNSFELKDIKVWNQIVYGKYEGEVNVDNVRLKSSHKPMDYVEYTKIYEKWSKNNTSLARFVSKEPENVLVDCAKKGLYFKFYVDEELAGIICGRKDPLYGYDAIYIFEELIFEKFRGKGLATIMQRLFHKEFPEIKYIWGHIVEENVPSFKTATGCGRKVLEKELFFSFI